MEHTAELILRAHDGDKAARERLVQENTGLVWCVVKRFYGRGMEAEDLFQIGTIGLIKAIDKFDLSYGVRFSTYAVPVIAGEIRRFLRDDGILKVSRSLKELAIKAGQAKEDYIMKYRKEPTVAELSEMIGVAKEELVQAMEAASEVESLQRPLHESDGSAVSLIDRLEEKTDPQEKVIDRMFLQSLLETLEKQERCLIYLRYFENRTQSQTGKILGISQVQVSRLEKKILNHMRNKAEK